MTIAGSFTERTRLLFCHPQFRAQRTVFRTGLEVTGFCDTPGRKCNDRPAGPLLRSLSLDAWQNVEPTHRAHPGLLPSAVGHRRRCRGIEPAYGESCPADARGGVLEGWMRFGDIAHVRHNSTNRSLSVRPLRLLERERPDLEFRLNQSALVIPVFYGSRRISDFLG